MSCGEPIRAPSSVVIATPKGGPVLVGGPPAVDLLTALTSKSGPGEAAAPDGTRLAPPHALHYDASGDLVQVTDPLGHAWRFEYKNHLLVRETDRNGLSFYFAYDGFGQDAYCVRTWGDGGIYDHITDYDKREAEAVDQVEHGLQAGGDCITAVERGLRKNRGKTASSRARPLRK